MFYISTGKGNKLCTAWNLRIEIAFPRVFFWRAGIAREFRFWVSRLPELGAASTHDFVLADQLGAEFTSVQCEVNVKVHSVEDTLRGIHALEVGLEVLARQVRREGDDFLNAFDGVSFEGMVVS
jgi:hypothetical protein